MSVKPDPDTLPGRYGLIDNIELYLRRPEEYDSYSEISDMSQLSVDLGEELGDLKAYYYFTTKIDPPIENNSWYASETAKSLSDDLAEVLDVCQDTKRRVETLIVEVTRVEGAYNGEPEMDVVKEIELGIYREILTYLFTKPISYEEGGYLDYYLFPEEE